MDKTLLMRNLILVLLIAMSSFAKAQSVSCQEVFSFILENGYKANSISLTYSSTMLTKVERYTYDGVNYVVGYIRENEYTSRSNPYLFCGISSYDWGSFQYNYMNSAGEAFHKYIMPYKCNCR